MKKCISCGSEINDAAKFCTVCGATQLETKNAAEQGLAEQGLAESGQAEQGLAESGQVEQEQTTVLTGQNLNLNQGAYQQGYIDNYSQKSYQQNNNQSPYQQNPNQGSYSENPYQQSYNQNQYQQSYAQNQYQQPYTQNQYQQNMYQQPNTINRKTSVEAINNVKSSFTKNVKKTGIGLYTLLGIIGAMLLIVAPFMNFASVHAKVKYDMQSSYIFGGMDKNIKVKVSDGLNMFELMKASNSLYSVADTFGYDAADLDDYLDAGENQIEDEIDYDDVSYNKGIIDEIMGSAKLIIKGHLALIITPFLIILSGLGLLVFTMIYNKKAKLICAAVPLVCLLWLAICSSHFFAILGIGAWAIIAGIILGGVSAIKETNN